MKSNDLSALLLRLATGLVFLPHGYGKVFGPNGPASFATDMAAYGIPSFLAYLACYAEFFGAALLIIGLFTRVDAFLLAATMAVATFRVQLPDALHDLQPGSLKAFSVIRGIDMPLLLLATSLAILLLGGGRWSLDAAFRIESRLLGIILRRPQTLSTRKWD